ncbi:MAG TPA: hypothetical protein VIS96_10380 [Terrimicrobiaceae bacterium]
MTTAARNSGSDFPGSIEIDGVILYKDEGEANTWLYVPGKPIPELSNGRPTLHLYVSASGGILQLGAQWAVAPVSLEMLKTEIAQRAGQDEAEIRLQPAPASVKQAAVETGDGKGSSVAVATSSSSGFPPYNAIFRVPLDPEKKNAVVAALNGRPGFVVVRYRAAATVKVSAHAVMKGDVASAAETLTSSSTLEEIVNWMNASVEGGRLSQSVTAVGKAGAPLLAKAGEMVVERFALALQEKLSKPEPIRPDESLLQIEALVSELVATDLERTTDVSEWFELGEGQNHITVLPGGELGTPLPPAEIKVGLGFPTAELPVAFIEARSADKKALLRPPDFKPVVLTTSGGVLQLTTHYTGGQSPYKTGVELSESERLDPAALGLTQIVVDGTGRRDAGIKDILLHLCFLPAGQGTPEDRTFHLHGHHWVASYFMATRGKPVAGEFDLEWTETTAEGKPRRRQLKAKDQAVFVLQN